MEQGFKIVPKFPVLPSDYRRVLDKAIGSGNLAYEIENETIISIICKSIKIAEQCEDYIKKSCKEIPQLKSISEKDFTRFTNDPVKIVPINISMDGYNSLWNEYKYRHDLIWRFIAKIIFATVAVVVIPYTKKSIVANLGSTGYWILLLIPIAIILFSAFVASNEIRRLNIIKTIFRDYQKEFFRVKHKERSYTPIIVGFLFALLFFLTLANIYLHEKPEIRWKNIAKAVQEFKCSDSNDPLCEQLQKSINNYYKEKSEYEIISKLNSVKLLIQNHCKDNEKVDKTKKFCSDLQIIIEKTPSE